MKVIYPKNEWVWYGYAGHLIVSKHCAYNLSTRIGPFLISTVGAYFPDRKDSMETIGAGENDYFETMVFPVDGEDKNGDPNITSLTELVCKRYATSNEAEHGHRKMCDKYARMKGNHCDITS